MTELLGNLGSSRAHRLDILEVADIATAVELNGEAGSAPPSLIAVFEDQVGVNDVTLYAWDESSTTAENPPYTVDGAGGQYIAIAGKYSYFNTTMPMYTGALATDPASSTATSTAIVDGYSGVIITLTAAGNDQTIGAPTDAVAGKKFYVVNNDTSTDNIDIIGAMTITVEPGHSQCFIWDGTAWIHVSSVDADEITFNPASVYMSSTNIQGAVEEMASATGLKVSSAGPTLDYYDTDTADGDISAQVLITATDVGSGTEDVDYQIYQQVAGTLQRTYFSDADQGHYWYIPDSSLGLVLDVSGNMGLGVTPKAWHANITALQIGDEGSIASWDAANGEMLVNQNAYYDGAWKYIASDSASQIQMVDGVIKLLVDGGTVTADATTDFTTALTIANDASSTFGGSLSIPSGSNLYLDGGSNTYFSEDSADQIAVYLGGGNYWTFKTSGIIPGGSNRPSLLYEEPSATNPSIVPYYGDADTGIGWAAEDQLSLIAGGVEGARIVEDAAWGISMHQPEITTPTAVASFYSYYSKADNLPYFQDGAGNEHTLLTLAGTQGYSSLWYNGTSNALTISVQDTYTLVTTFANVGDEDASANVVGDATTDDDMTINLAGTYRLDFQSSISAVGGASKEYLLGVKVELATGLTITDATNATPIVITSTAHGLKTGDGCTITGVTTNTAANGDWLITWVDANSFQLQDTSWANSTGNGAYGGGGTVDSICPGNTMFNRVVSGTEVGRGAASGDYVLAVGDLVTAFAVNRDGTENLAIHQVQMSANFKG